MDKWPERGTDINGNFVGLKSETEKDGGAICNSWNSIGNITGNFIGNGLESNVAEEYVYGGAIYNAYGSATIIESIIGNFIGNYTKSVKDAAGGAIYNGDKGNILNIVGNFVGNYTIAQTYNSEGGAIANFNQGNIGDVTGDFLFNYSYSNQLADGGAIMNYSKAQIGDITGDFIGNYVKSLQNFVNGGAIFNNNGGKIGDITGHFIGNFLLSEQGEAHGGAIYNYHESSIGNIDGDFIANYSQGVKTAHGGAIDNCESTIGDITGDFAGNYAKANENVYGGAIYNYKDTSGKDTKIGNIKGDFVGNYVSSVSGKAYGGAIYNNLAEIGNIEGTFYGNRAEGAESNGGAIANDGTMGYVSGNFVSNSASTNGGAVYNAGSIGNSSAKSLEEDNKGIYNSSFYNNTAGSHGGAIYTEKSLKITADGAVSEFASNKANGESEAIYVKKADGDEDVTLTMSAENSGKFNFYDAINGEEGYKIAITGDDSGEVNLYNKISNADIKHENATTNVFDAKYLNNSNSLDMQSGTLNINNFGLTQLNFRKFGIQGGTINIDSVNVSLAEKIMGRITADEYSEQSKDGTINVNDMKLLSDSPDLVTPINFADKSFANTVHSSIHRAYAPIYQYSVDYIADGSSKTSAGETGDFLFTRLGYNPSVFASSVAQLAGGYASMIQTYDYSFEHADTFSALPAYARKAMLNANKYAITEGKLPLYNNYINQNALWFRPYTSFESIPLKNGPKTSTVLYGSYIGGDSEIFHLYIPAMSDIQAQVKVIRVIIHIKMVLLEA